MKTSLLTLAVGALLTGAAFAAPARPAAAAPGAASAPAKSAAAAPAGPSVSELFGGAIEQGFRLGLAGEGVRVARCECEESKEVCEKSCELWNQNGTCAKWGLPVCIEKCVKWSCEEKH